MVRHPVPLAALALLLLVVSAAPARAGDFDARVDALERRIDVLTHEARLLRRQGDADAAEVFERRVHALQRELVELRQEEAREDDDADDEAEEILAHVFETLGRLAEADDDKEAVEVLMRALHALAADVEAKSAEEREADAVRLESAEREAAKGQLAAMRTAFHAFREAERKDAAHLMEHAIHALELRLKGRRDEEAMKVCRTAPGREKLVHLLRQAGELWEGWGHEAKATQVRALARAWGGVEPRRQEERPEVRLSAEEARFCLKAMKLAVKAFQKAEKPELAKTMHLAASSLAVQVEGRDDPEARAMVARRPDAERVVEGLLQAGNLYRAWERGDEAAVCTKAGKLLLERRREGRPTVKEHAAAIERFEKLQRQTRELLETARRMQAELERLQRELQR